MKMIKIFSFLLLPVLFFACQKIDTSAPTDGRKKILSTIAQIGDLVADIGGDRIDSQVLVRGELNPHVYELVKGDDEKIQRADLIFYNGLGLEHGASVSSMLTNHPHSFAIGDSIQQRHPNRILWKGPVADPHIWMDVSLWKESVDPIAEQLSLIDPEGKEYYAARATQLKAKMDEADQEMKIILQSIPPQKRFLVTSHDAFHYFTRSYLAEEGEENWQQRFAAPEGLAPDGQLNPLDLQKIIDHLHRHRIETLFPESNVSRDSIRKIAAAGKQKGLEVRICKEALYGDSMRGAYLDAMKHNAKTIAESLGAP
jgi:manganese/zinc/iron transport system substrate-binding protein